MATLRTLFAVALAEARSVRRLTRTWLFAVLVVILGLVAYAYFTATHTMTSGVSSIVGIVNPRFIMAGLSAYAIWLLAAAAVFLAFDVCARDARERVADAVDSRPMGNLTLLGGRLAALSLAVWLPLLAMLLLVQGVGALASQIGEGLGDTVDWRSLAILLFVDAPPALVLWCSLVVLLAVTVRYRLLVVLIALALLGAWLWWTFEMPIYLHQALSGISVALRGSEVSPRSVQGVEWAQRGCQYLLAGGFLCLAAALHPRPDQGPRAIRLAAGSALVVVAGAGIAALVASANNNMERRAHWAAAHEALRGEARADVQRVAGHVGIAPGDALRFDLDYAVLVPDGAETLVFTLNPGMRVGALRMDGGATGFAHEHGLLTVPVPPGPRREVALTIAASGVPDPAFAYLDAAIDVARLPGRSPLVLMGTEAALFEEDYVAVLPGVFWMPVAGVAVGRDSPPDLGRDYFRVDLRVEVPSGWLAAGPGRRAGAAGRFRFRPSAPVPEVGLLAARFERFATNLAGVALEVLVSPVHVNSILQFADAADEIETALAELLTTAADIGLPYPYGGLSLVETPAQLRTFGGGWRMATVQAMPGVLMLRENGLPNAGLFHGARAVENASGRQGGVPRHKANVLRAYFQNDVAGGNPVHGVVRNLFEFQTSARGDGAVALDFVVHDLAVRLVSGEPSGFFSPHLLRAGAAMRGSLLDTADRFRIARVGSDAFGRTVQAGATRRPGVWERALAASLKDLGANETPEHALNALWLKGPEVARALMDGLGRSSAAALLAELKRRHAGGTFTEQDFNAAAAAVGIDLQALLGDWLDVAALPGFVLAPLHVVRLPDDDRGEQRYQISLHVLNDEPVPGLVRLAYQTWQRDRLPDAAPPTRIAAKSAVELGLVVASLPAKLWLDPYLSLNRDTVHVALPEAEDVLHAAATPFSGARPSAWRPEKQAGVVVDDLDDGFSVHVDEVGRGARVSGAFAHPSTETDQGIPVFGSGARGGWVREKWPGAHGKYRQTVAKAARGDGAKALFRAMLPTPGRWRLEYHVPPVWAFSGNISPTGEILPPRPRLDVSRGTYEVTVFAAGGATEIVFHAAAGETGWNRLRDFDLPSGEVLVQVSNQTTGQYAVADAIRWLPLEDR